MTNEELASLRDRKHAVYYNEGNGLWTPLLVTPETIAEVL